MRAVDAVLSMIEPSKRRRARVATNARVAKKRARR